MENWLCPQCGSGNTAYIRSDIPKGKASGCRIDLEMHPLLYRCCDCGEVFPITENSDPATITKEVL